MYKEYLVRIEISEILLFRKFKEIMKILIVGKLVGEK